MHFVLPLTVSMADSECLVMERFNGYWLLLPLLFLYSVSIVTHCSLGCRGEFGFDLIQGFGPLQQYFQVLTSVTAKIRMRALSFCISSYDLVENNFFRETPTHYLGVWSNSVCCIQSHPLSHVNTLLFLVRLLSNAQKVWLELLPSRPHFLAWYIKEPFLNKNMHKYTHTTITSTCNFLWDKIFRLNGCWFLFGFVFFILYFFLW